MRPPSAPLLFVRGRRESTSGSSYQEYLIERIDVNFHTYEYDCCPDEPWPVATYKYAETPARANRTL